ncbi:hypothetical protein OAI33_15190 [Pirellulaceae bacterium]|nr:hypothetical protein [Pirellulaceae bacterium]
MRIRFSSLPLVYIVSLFICSTAWGQKHELGDLLEVPVTIAANEVNLRFRYVSPNALPVTEPWFDAKETALYRSSGFYVLETELSIADAVRILGPNLLESPMDKLRRNVELDDDGGTWDFYVNALNNNSEDVPFFGISIKELILLCDVLSKASTSQNLPEKTIEGRTIRPLTVSEWRLATIGKLHSQASVEHILFPNYPSPGDLDKEVYKGIKQRLRTAYKSMNTGREFNGSVGDLYAIFSRKFDRETKIQVDEALRMLYCQAMLTQAKPRQLKQALPNSAIRNKYSLPNSIGVYDLMNGLTEWVIASNDETEAILQWESLVRNAQDNVVDDPVGVPALFSLAGKSSMQSVTSETPGFWRTSTLWGSPKMNLAEGRMRQYNLTTFDEQSWDVFAGIRLGVFRSLRPNWFEVVRNAHLNEFNVAQEPQRVFASFENTLSELVTDEKLGKVSASVINFYKSLAYYNLQESVLVENSLAKLDFPKVTPPPEIISEEERAERRKELFADPRGFGGGTGIPVFKKKKTATYTATTPAGENGLFGDILIELTRLDNELVKGKTVPSERALTKTE